MNKFAKINDIYKQYFKTKPPVRVCVSLPVSEENSKALI